MVPAISQPNWYVWGVAIAIVLSMGGCGQEEKHMQCQADSTDPDCIMMHDAFLVEWLQSKENDIAAQQSVMCKNSADANDDYKRFVQDRRCEYLNIQRVDIVEVLQLVRRDSVSKLKKTYHGDLAAVVRNLLSILKTSCNESFIVETHQIAGHNNYRAYLIMQDIRDKGDCWLYEFNRGYYGWSFVEVRRSNLRKVEVMFQAAFQMDENCRGTISDYGYVGFTKVDSDSVSTRLVALPCEDLSQLVKEVMHGEPNNTSAER